MCVRERMAIRELHFDAYESTIVGKDQDVWKTNNVLKMKAV